MPVPVPASSGLMSVFWIVFIPVVVLLLFLVLFVYLRRVAPEGEVAGEETTKPEPVPLPAGKLPGSVTCKRCGIDVKPAPSNIGRICPNCGFGI